MQKKPNWHIFVRFFTLLIEKYLHNWPHLFKILPGLRICWVLNDIITVWCSRTILLKCSKYLDLILLFDFFWHFYYFNKTALEHIKVLRSFKTQQNLNPDKILHNKDQSWNSIFLSKNGPKTVIDFFTREKCVFPYFLSAIQGAPLLLSPPST